MSNATPTLNPFTGDLQLTINATLLKLRGVVATVDNLPLTNNDENDCYIVSADDRIYTWNSSSSSGLVTAWVNVGSSTTIDWSVITNKPSSSTANIDSAVSLKHAAGSDDQDLSGKVDKVAGSSLVVDTEIAKIHASGSDNQDFIPPRTNTIASSALPAINVGTTDIFTITALSENITSMTTNLTGSPVNGQKLIIRILDAGVAKSITWGLSFISRGAILPATTIAGKYMYIGLVFNNTANVFDCVAVSQEA
jgi:hypothetical protein